jgi:hypothetical protein
MTEEIAGSELDDPVKDLGPLKDAPVAPAHVVATIALSMAVKFHDINMVKDGALYQQYKLEGKNFRPLTLDTVFEDAIKIEAWLLGASDRIAKLIVDAIAVKVEDDEAGSPKDAT